MAENLVENNRTIFERIKETDDDGNEFWSARKLAKALEYAEFRNFFPVIEKAIEACSNSGQNPADHIVHYHEMIEIGKGGFRQFDSYKLSRDLS